jgi:phage baseplate assembly protein W
MSDSPFLGKGLKWPIVNKFESSEGVDKLLEDIQGLLLTNIGERVMRPLYGCNLNARIWENIDDIVIQGPSDIAEAINKYEPRVSLIEVLPLADRSRGLVFFKIRFVILANNTEANLVFPFKSASEISGK